MIDGGVPRVLKSGPRKGRSTWKGQPTTRVVVTAAEVAAEEERYEAVTGKCRRCAGSKVHMVSSSVEHGIRYGRCWRCKGTGLPVVGPMAG